ncbi:hypothetical protein AB0M07_46775, partial [Streptomyces sp. NPDC052015]
MTDKQHKADLDRVASQNSITDFARGVEERPRGGLFNNLVRSAVDATPFGQAMHGRTNFELHDLNQMLDLVEQTNPEDLESSARPLGAKRGGGIWLHVDHGGPTQGCVSIAEDA